MHLRSEKCFFQTLAVAKIREKNHNKKKVPGSRSQYNISKGESKDPDPLCLKGESGSTIPKSGSGDPEPDPRQNGMDPKR